MPSVLIVAHHYPPHIGGLEVVAWRQAQSLAENGYQVTVLTSRYGSSGPQSDGPGQIEVIRVPCWHLFESAFSIVFPLFSPSLLYKLWQQVKRAQVVHIHDVFYMSSWAACIFASLAQKPIVLTQHVALVSHSSNLVMLIQRLVYATAGRWIFSKARQIIVYNRRVFDFLHSRGIQESQILLMANGIDTAMFCPGTLKERTEIRARFGLPLERRLILFVGRLVEQKGYEILLASREPSFDIVLVGPGSTHIRSADSNVHWIGPLDQNSTREMYRACDLFVFPAIGEVFPLVIQEAMASGLPVITTKEPAYDDAIACGSVILSRRDAASFKAAIIRLLSDTNRMSELAAQGRMIAVRHFDWRENVSQLLDVYSAVLGWRRNNK